MPTVSGFTIASSVNTTTDNGYTLNQFAELYVPVGVGIFATGSTFSGVFSSTGASLENHGAIAGFLYGVDIGAASAFTSIVNDAGATISNYVNVGAAISVTGHTPNGSFSLLNYGLVSGASGAPAVLANGQGTITNTGTISSNSGTAISQIDSTAGDSVSFYNSDTGVLNGGYNGSSSTITETISNHGSIKGSVSFGSGNNDFMSNSGSATISFGTVSFGSGNFDRFQNFGGLGNLTMGGGSNDYVENFGTIDGSLTINGANATVINAGRINGQVTLSGANAVFNSTAGTLYSNTQTNPDGASDPNGAGSIFASNAGSTIVGAENGGLIYGGTGNDILIANQTQAAALTYHATTTMDGGGGTNAMYGGGGLNNFVSGDTQFNQIWGGISQTAGFISYTNNTVSYATAAAGVFVDLLNGHDAYVDVNAGKGWDGNGRFEDSIANVPNVIGSAYADVIQCDNGTDRIAGGVGADSLYAGGGQDTFVYTSSADSNLNTGYDTIVGFKLATDKIDLTAFHSDPTHVAISTAGTSNTVYWEVTPGTFNAATDLALVVNTTTTGGLTASNFLF
jgi:hypothetical protein